MSQALTARVSAALQQIVNPRTGEDLVSSEQVANIGVTLDGKVRLELRLASADDATLARTVRQAVEKVNGVTAVHVDVRDAGQAAAAPDAAPSRQPRTLPVMSQPSSAQQPSAPQPIAYPHLGRIIAVSSGKGGVGKSTVTVNLAVALAQQGKRVGILDADIYGPNLPLMLGVNAPPAVDNEKIIPLEAHGLKVISLGFLIERDQPAIWRGPIVMKIITQFLRDVDWGQLDYLFVDMPPGTGDAQLSLVQAAKIEGAVIVTTPQEVAVGDALRGAKMFERVGVPVLGIVENMSWFESPETGKPMAIFGSGGGQRLADELGVPLLGQVPLYPPVGEGGDTGRPIVVADPSCSAAKQLMAVAGKLSAH
ncbi:MAG: Mrp/NBP35 family ATP-binding protein [Gemmatimonadaceae bacterium]|nr:Mrp/NBP35 family ATP-binding protein [Gemmatimonadaceae bacterium]